MRRVSVRGVEEEEETDLGSVRVGVRLRWVSHPVSAHIAHTNNIVCRVVKRRRKKPVRDAQGGVAVLALKLLATLASPPSDSRALSSEFTGPGYSPLELNLDRGNRFSHPVSAHIAHTNNIVCRVVKRRSIDEAGQRPWGRRGGGD
jgi:hypothetical protein